MGIVCKCSGSCSTFNPFILGDLFDHCRLNGAVILLKISLKLDLIGKIFERELFKLLSDQHFFFKYCQQLLLERLPK